MTCIGSQSSISRYYEIDGQMVERDNGMAMSSKSYKSHAD